MGTDIKREDRVLVMRSSNGKDGIARLGRKITAMRRGQPQPFVFSLSWRPALITLNTFSKPSAETKIYFTARSAKPSALKHRG